MRPTVASAVALMVVAGWLAAGQIHAAAQGRAGAAQDAERRHVILVSIDGFAAFHLADATIDLPNIRALAAAGTQAGSSESVFPTGTRILASSQERPCPRVESPLQGDVRPRHLRCEILRH